MNAKKMNAIDKVHIKDSIATRLLKIVFAIYLTITVSVTAFHMIGEYLYIEDDIKRELRVLNHSFNRSISTALFHLDFEQLNQNLKGALDIPSIVGMKIIDYTTNKEIQGGVVTERQLNRGESFLRYIGFGGLFKLISNRMPVFSLDDSTEKIGEVVLFSSSEVVFGRVKLGFIFIIINSIIKTVALWGIFLIVGRRILIRPLHKLTRAAQAINIHNLENLQIDIRTTEGNELKALESAFNDMIKKLHFEMTERVQAESRLQAIMNNTPTAIYLVDLEGKFQMVNREFEIQFDVLSDHIVNCNYYDIFPKNVADNSVMNDMDVIRKGVPLAVEEKFELKGEDRTFITVKFPIKDKDRQVTMVCGILTDITQRKKAEEDLQAAYMEMENHVAERTKDLQKANQDLYRANAKANAATKSKSEFLANMSHEIRTPMNGVIAAADLALNLELSAEARKYLNIIKSSGDSLLSIINDILDISKIEAGKLELEVRPFRLDRLLETITSLFIKKMQDEKIEILIDVKPDIPLSVKGDSLRLKQVITNLVGNAIKFTPKGGCITLGVHHSEEDTNGLNDEMVRLTFYVQDTGTGIKPENINKLFEQFTQENLSTARKYGGSGLGLTICKHIVELMGGKIWIESEYGRGTTFFFDILIGRQAQPSAPESDIYRDIKGLNILVIDDNRNSLKITGKYLEFFECRSTLVSSGKEAITFLKDGTFDIVIVDWVMPELDGLETVEILRQELKLSIPVIMMTAFMGNLDKKSAHQAGVDYFLSKPISSMSLLDAILRAIGKTGAAGTEMESTADGAGKASFKKRDLAGRRILVAEDNLTNQEIAKAVLQNTGAVVEIVNNGKEAVEAVLNGSFDIVLMDIQMPEMDGYEATRAIRRKPQFAKLPVIAMTAHAMKGDKEKCIEAGMNDYITKPINQQDLFAALSQGIVAQSAQETTPTESSGNMLLVKNIWKAYDDQSFMALLNQVRLINKQAKIRNNIKVVNITKNIERLCVDQKTIQKSLIEALVSELAG